MVECSDIVDSSRRPLIIERIRLSIAMVWVTTTLKFHLFFVAAVSACFEVTVCGLEWNEIKSVLGVN